MKLVNPDRRGEGWKKEPDKRSWGGGGGGVGREEEGKKEIYVQVPGEAHCSEAEDSPRQC